MWEKYLWKFRWFGPWFVFKAAVVGCHKSEDGARVPCSQSLHGLCYCDSLVSAISQILKPMWAHSMTYTNYDMRGLPLTHHWAEVGICAHLLHPERRSPPIGADIRQNNSRCQEILEAVE